MEPCLSSMTATTRGPSQSTKFSSNSLDTSEDSCTLTLHLYASCACTAANHTFGAGCALHIIAGTLTARTGLCIGSYSLLYVVESRGTPVINA